MDCRKNALLAGIMAPLLLATCAIPPDVKDMTDVDPYEIVRHIRCEMRDAIRHFARNAIVERQSEMASQLISDDDFVAFDDRRLQPEAQALSRLYGKTIIGYEFTFDTSEHNKVEAGIGLLREFTRGAISANIGADHTHDRQNVETFRIVDTFSKLVRVDNNYCGGASPLPKAYNYPITGSLNLKEYVGRFFNLNERGNLADATGSNNVSKYGVSLKFTTILHSNVAAGQAINDPSIIPNRSWELVDIKAGVDLSREDIDQVNIVFILPTKASSTETIAETRLREELDYLRSKDDLRSLEDRFN